MHLETEITELERELERCSSRTVLKAAQDKQAQAEAEVVRVQNQSRTWARVHDEEARAQRAEASRDEALTRLGEAEAALVERSGARAKEHQELLTLRGRVKV